MSLSDHSMLRLLIPMGTGISFSLVSGIDVHALWFSFIVLLLSCAAGAFAFPYFFSRRTRWIPGLLITLLFSCAGLMAGAFSLRQDIPKHFTTIPNPETALIRISGPVKAGTGRVSAFGEVKGLITPEGFSGSRGKTRITIYTEETEGIRDGQTWLVPARFRSPSERLTAGGFDYPGWLRKRGVRQLLYLNLEEMVLWKDAKNNSITAWGRKQQQSLTRRIQVLLDDSLRAGLAAAMLIGERSMLDEEISASFRQAGVVHVLCVSGLHTGTVYAAALGILTLLVPYRKRKAWMEILPLILVGAFAVMTGLAPSVSRASLMLSLFALSRMMKRHTRGLNILAGAAFLMLLIHPEWRFALGFQLSVLAVASIMTFATPLLSAFSARKGWFRKFFAGMLIVSLVAQAGTAGVTLHSFHSFPLYFLPANLISVPLATLGIYSGICMLIMDMTGLPAQYVSGVFAFILDAMTGVNAFVSELPAAFLEHIRFNCADQAFYYLVLTTIALTTLSTTKGKLLKTLLLFLIVWNLYGILHKGSHQRNNSIWVLEGDPLIIAEQQGRNPGIWVFDSVPGNSGNRKTLKQWMRSNCMVQQAADITFCGTYPEKNNIAATLIRSDASDIIVSRHPARIELSHIHDTNYILVTGLAGLREIERWNKKLRPGLVIFDRSVRYIGRWAETELEERGIPYWLMRRQGHWKKEQARGFCCPQAQPTDSWFKCSNELNNYSTISTSILAVSVETSFLRFCSACSV